jgi:hypothetical protein
LTVHDTLVFISSRSSNYGRRWTERGNITQGTIYCTTGKSLSRGKEISHTKQAMILILKLRILASESVTNSSLRVLTLIISHQHALQLSPIDSHVGFGAFKGFNSESMSCDLRGHADLVFGVRRTINLHLSDVWEERKPSHIFVCFNCSRLALKIVILIP